MDRRRKVVALARAIEAGRAEAADLVEKKEKRDAADRESDVKTMKPDEYRQKHGRCPPGHQYDPLSDTCESSDPEPGEPKSEQTKEERQEEKREARERQEERKEEREERKEEKDEPAGKPTEEQLTKRKERREKLKKLFDEDFEGYQKEVARMRETGELPDRETSALIAKVKNVDDLPDEVLKDKKKLQKVIEQQAAQREHEELVLKKTEEKLKDLERQREVAEKAGKEPPKINPVKLFRSIEEQYGRPLVDSPEREKKLKQSEDLLSDVLLRNDETLDRPSYELKKWFERLLKPVPKWTPGGGATASREGQMELMAALDSIADELEARGRDASLIDRVAEVVARTSPGITNMAPTEIGFPPYDKERPARRHMPGEPSGRSAFPPYDEFVPYEDTARDASMQGFPPYDGKGGAHDTETIGLPPYNNKLPHMGRGFPPFAERKSVYKERKEAVEEAVR